MSNKLGREVWGPLIAVVAVMLLLPWLLVNLVDAGAGMTVTLLLFFVVNPLFCLWLGSWAGADVKRRWFWPALAAAAFVAGCWLVLDMGETNFLYYAGGYLLIGCVEMLFKAANITWRL
ncbi:MAG: hypothetical protein IJE29_00515 [Firmicutes bacterium]|nr:hypothetical protein [Bacillota bacterium]MBQ3200154.1 hypothetical protein [Bacillota bacterium]